MGFSQFHHVKNNIMSKRGLKKAPTPLNQCCLHLFYYSSTGTTFLKKTEVINTGNNIDLGGKT